MILDGANFNYVMGKWLDSMGYSTPVEAWVPNSPALIEAWRDWAARNAVNVAVYPRPNLRALVGKNLAAWDTYLTTQTNYTAMMQAKNEYEAKINANEIHAQMAVLIAKNAFWNQIEASLKAKRDRLVINGVVIGPYLNAGSIVLMLTEEQRENMVLKAQKKAFNTLKRVPALSNNPRP